jgi:flagellar biosynthesis protein FliR
MRQSPQWNVLLWGQTESIDISLSLFCLIIAAIVISVINDRYIDTPEDYHRKIEDGRDPQWLTPDNRIPW